MRSLRSALAAAAFAAVLAGASVCAAAPADAASPAPSPQARSAPSNAVRDWYFMSRGEHVRPGIPSAAARLLRRYSGHWIGPRHHRIVYLTFDAASEFGTTLRIIRILDRAHVKASFFLTGTYMRDNPGITRRLANHGRLARFFRAPYGTYSARVLWLAERLGYATVFWSFAHVDYDEHAQPPVSVTRARLLAAACPGALYLLHAASTSNVGALADVIRVLKRRGYHFATLDALP